VFAWNRAWLTFSQTLLLAADPFECNMPCTFQHIAATSEPLGYGATVSDFRLLHDVRAEGVLSQTYQLRLESCNMAINSNYSVSGLCPQPGILNARKRNFRKLRLFPSSGDGWETPTLLSLLERANPNHLANRVGVPPSPEDGNRCSLRKLRFPVLRIPHYGQSPGIR
jgi:hypothetical protein